VGQREADVSIPRLPKTSSHIPHADMYHHGAVKQLVVVHEDHGMKGLLPWELADQSQSSINSKVVKEALN